MNLGLSFLFLVFVCPVFGMSPTHPDFKRQISVVDAFLRISFSLSPYNGGATLLKCADYEDSAIEHEIPVYAAVGIIHDMRAKRLNLPEFIDKLYNLTKVIIEDPDHVLDAEEIQITQEYRLQKFDLATDLQECYDMEYSQKKQVRENREVYKSSFMCELGIRKILEDPKSYKPFIPLLEEIKLMKVRCAQGKFPYIFTE